MENYRLTQTGEEVQDILNGAAMQTDLTAEVERAEGAEQTLQGNIDEEERRAKAAEETLSGAIGDEELRAKAAEEALGGAIDGINAKIPAAASSENKLADQDFVNSSIETATATFRGTYNLVSDLHLAVDATHEQIATLLGTVIAEADKNDYSYVLIPTSAQTPTEIASIEKYTFGANGWAFAYALNNSGFTSAQWAAINSGITSGLVAKLNALPTNTDLLALLAGKQDVLTFDDVPVEGSNNPVKSGGVHSAIDDEKTARVNAVNGVAGRVDTIEGEIPAQASSENQLADKAYVNSSISTNTATYRGSFNLVADLGLSVSATHEQIGTALAGEISTADNNDYAYVQVPTSDETPSQILKVERYKFNGTAWAFEYELNNSGFTSAQWAAINSGITSGLVGKLNALPTNDELTLALAGKQDVLTFDNTPTENSNNPVKSGGVYAADKALSDAIEAILLLIPSAATSLNKLVDTDLMNSSISTATATFRGTFNLVSDLSLDLTATHAQIATALAGEISTADNNDYCFVQIPTAVGTPTEIAQTDRYKFNGTAWAYEYTLNTSGFTSAQWAAINSGITAALVASLADIPDLIPSEATSANQLADKAYVLAQILAATPAFKGQFTTLAELQAVASPKAGDLGIVRTKDSDGMDVFTVYQYLNNAWNVFYSLSYHPQTKPATTGTTGDYPYNGMGRVELAKNMVNGVNTLTQDMFYKGAVGSRVPNTNTIFVIQYDYVLGEDITVPANCMLEFDGGSISGAYTITGNNTGIEAGLVKIFNTDVTLYGTWNVSKSYSVWFGDDNNSIGKVCIVSDNVFLTKKTYTLPSSVSLTGRSIKINGNGCTIKRSGVFEAIISTGGSLLLCDINFDGDNEACGIIYVVNSEDVKVSNCSFINAGNPQPTGLYVNNAYDGICVLNSTKVTIDECLFDTIERTGCQCNGVNYFYVTNSQFYRCGNEAATNDGSMSATTRFVFETIYKNNIVSDCYGGGFSAESVGTATAGDTIDYNRITDAPSYEVKSKLIIKDNVINNCGLNLPQGKDYLHALLAGQYTDSLIEGNTIKKWHPKRNAVKVNIAAVVSFSTCSSTIQSNDFNDINYNAITFNNNKIPSADLMGLSIIDNNLIFNNNGIIIERIGALKYCNISNNVLTSLTTDDGMSVTEEFVVNDSTQNITYTDYDSAIKVKDFSGNITNNKFSSLNNKGCGILFRNGSTVVIEGNMFMYHFKQDVYFAVFETVHRAQSRIANNSFIMNNVVTYTYNNHGAYFEIKNRYAGNKIELWFPEYDVQYLGLKDISFAKGDIMHTLDDGSTYFNNGTGWEKV